jgi:hypothetical protein
MTDKQAVSFIADTFKMIKASLTVSDLDSASDILQIPHRNRMNLDFYPKIEFDIQPEEILSLIEKKIITADLNFSADIAGIINDPFSKLLYAAAWKNGDLSKIRHIIKGILEVSEENSSQDSALVFYQFGKYLTKTPGQPIIDQHVIRAFAVYRSEEINEILPLRKLSAVDKKHASLIREYKKWLSSEELTYELKNEKDYAYHIDKLLFAAGKTIKLH